MKNLKILLLFALLACMQKAVAAETEPNDTKAQANMLALNSSNTGAIGTATDVDWWQVTTTADGRLDIGITVSNGLNLWCQIYDNDGITVLEQNYTASNRTVSKDGLTAGTYYLKLYPYYSGQMPAYTISSALAEPLQANDNEPNGTKALALTLPLNSSVTGHINFYYNNQRDSADWYKVTTNADGRIRLTMSSGNGEYVWAYLYDNDGVTQLDAGYTSGTAAVVNKDGLAAGTYYVKVKTYYSSNFAPYTLSDSLFVPAQANDNEPNDSRAAAITLPLNDSVTGHANYYYNNKRDSSDWYKLVTGSDGRIRLKMKSGNGENIWAYLYDNDGVTQLDAGYTSGTAFVVDKDGLAAGTYYVKVKTYYSNEFAPYTLSDSLFTGIPDDAEPNNSRAAAITLPLNDSVTGHINYYYSNKRDSSDWYKLVTNSDGRIRLKMQSLSGQYVWAYLYDNDGTTQLDAGYTAGTAFVVNKDGLAAGTYYVKVRTYYSNDFAPYILSDSLFTTVDDDGEPNNSKAQAIDLPLNDSVTGHTNYFYNNKRDSSDWYKLVTTLDGRIQLKMQSLNGQYVWAYLYDNDGTTELASGYTAGTAIVVNKDGLAAGTYYVKVKTYYSSDFAPYRLGNTLDTYVFVKDNEPNDYAANAQVITPNTATDGHVGFYYNNSRDGNDWFKLKYTGLGELKFTVKQETLFAGGLNYLYFKLYKDTAASPIHSSYAAVASRDIELTSLTKGDYWIKINSYYSNDYSSYSFTNTFEAHDDLCDGIDNDGDGETDEDAEKFTWYADADGDGFGNLSVKLLSCSMPAGYVADSTDCNDADNAIYPNAPELCDGKDNDCDGSTDEDGGVTWYKDADGDGFGDASDSKFECAQPAGYVADKTDCNDADNTIYPGAPEVCDGKDNDCDGNIDEDGGVTWYKDADGDGFGDASMSQTACAQPTGYVIDKTDCNDADNTIYPGAAEICDGKDNDCDGSIDEDGGVTWYKDADGDGFGNASISQTACTQPTGFVADKTDCNDADNAIYPGAPEFCDGKDNDCDGSIDEDGGVTWYKDADGDGFGDASISQTACTQPTGYVSDKTDCNDADNTIYPGAPEFCDDKDNDCDGNVDEDGGVTWYRDADGDGFGDASVSQTTCAQPTGYVTDKTDCNDADNTIYPGAPEICDGKDNDCDGNVDEDGGVTWYKDADGDGFGDASMSQTACTQPTGYVADKTDCNDADNTIYPGAPELCDGKDNDCDGDVDEDGGVTWYKDADGDGFGDASISQITCAQPAGYVADNTDCNDADNTVYPGAPEVVDGKDNDCDGEVDEDTGAGTRISINDMIWVEPDLKDAKMFFYIRLNERTNTEVRVDYATQDRTAKAGADYIPLSGTAVFAPGEKWKRIEVTIKGDQMHENNEWFNVVLTNPVNATIANGKATAIIVDNDKAQAIVANNNDALNKQSLPEKSLKLSPNPAQVTTLVSLAGYSGTVTIRLSNMQGKMLLEKKVKLAASRNATEPLDISKYANGTYVVSVADEKGNVQTAKLVVQK